MKKTLIFTITAFVFFLLPVLVNNPTYAADCLFYSNKPGPHYNHNGRPNTTAKITGINCENTLGAGQYSKVLQCIGSSGYRYTVTYCTGSNDAYYPTGNISDPAPMPAGCEETYSEEGQGTAPASCNRPDPATESEITKKFGLIMPPVPIQNLGFGALGISNFLSNFIQLIYSIAAVVLVLMIVWGAWDWITSEG